ncbi:MAG: hemolysin family protein [Spirochaetaceae bacterium]|jgi:putative hemolysin|nr:hemolysin family protein [Spirochaetaceae bacterium]
MEKPGNDPIFWQLLLQLGLIACNAVFACAEIALISINTVRLEKSAAGGNRRAKQLLSLTVRPAKFLATIQVGITLAGFLGSAFAADNFSKKLAAALSAGGFAAPPEITGAVSLVLITLILSFLTLVLGELVPKRIAMRRAESLAFALASPLVFISKLFAPAVWLLTKSTNALLRLFGIDPEAEEKAVTEEEIRLLIDAGSAKGSILAGETEIIHNVFEFNDKTAGEVMTHRRKTILLWLKDDDTSWEKTIIEGRHNFYPVCGETVDDIRGVLNARDYLGLTNRERKQVMERAVRPPQLAPNTVKTNVLFNRMKTRRNHFALILDEYGSLDGIITMNDLLEELVGDMPNADDKVTVPLIEKNGTGLWRINGAAPLDKVEKETGVSLPVEQYDTFGGFVFTLLGRVPDDGERYELRYPPEAEEKSAGSGNGGSLHITITSVKDHRLESALVRLSAEPEKNP